MTLLIPSGTLFESDELKDTIDAFHPKLNARAIKHGTKQKSKSVQLLHTKLIENVNKEYKKVYSQIRDAIANINPGPCVSPTELISTESTEIVMSGNLNIIRYDDKTDSFPVKQQPEKPIINQIQDPGPGFAEVIDMAPADIKLMTENKENNHHETAGIEIIEIDTDEDNSVGNNDDGWMPDGEEIDMTLIQHGLPNANDSMEYIVPQVNVNNYSFGGSSEGTSSIVIGSNLGDDMFGSVSKALLMDHNHDDYNDNQWQTSQNNEQFGGQNNNDQQFTGNDNYGQIDMEQQHQQQQQLNPNSQFQPLQSTEPIPMPLQFEMNQQLILPSPDQVNKSPQLPVLPPLPSYLDFRLIVPSNQDSLDTMTQNIEFGTANMMDISDNNTVCHIPYNNYNEPCDSNECHCEFCKISSNNQLNGDISNVATTNPVFNDHRVNTSHSITPSVISPTIPTSEEAFKSFANSFMNKSAPYQNINIQVQQPQHDNSNNMHTQSQTQSISSSNMTQSIHVPPRAIPSTSCNMNPFERMDLFNCNNNMLNEYDDTFPIGDEKHDPVAIMCTGCFEAVSQCKCNNSISNEPNHREFQSTNNFLSDSNRIHQQQRQSYNAMNNNNRHQRRQLHMQQLNQMRNCNVNSTNNYGNNNWDAMANV